jgi:hypothetical protein
MNCIVSRAYLPKTVLMLVDEPGFPYSRHEYESFREYLQREVRIDIPIHGWNHWFIRFGPNGTVKAILSKKPWIRSAVGRAEDLGTSRGVFDQLVNE